MTLTCSKCRGLLKAIDEDTFVCTVDDKHRYQALYINPNAPATLPKQQATTPSLAVPPPPASKRPVAMPVAQPIAAPNPVAAASPPQQPHRDPCINHQEKTADTACSQCGIGICETCTFELPGGYRLCPECVTREPTSAVTGKRLAAMVCGIGLAVLGLIGFAVGSSVAAMGAGMEMLGGFIVLASIAISIGGLGSSAGALSKRQGNPWFVWAAFIVSLVIVCLLFLIMLIGVIVGVA